MLCVLSFQPRCCAGLGLTQRRVTAGVAALCSDLLAA